MKKIITALIFILFFALAVACSNNEIGDDDNASVVAELDVVEYPVGEQVNEAELSRNGHPLIDPDEVNITPLINNVSMQENSDIGYQVAHMLSEIGIRYNEELGFAMFTESCGFAVVRFIANDPAFEQTGETLSVDFIQTQRMMHAIFNVGTGEEELDALREILVNPEAQEAFDQAVIQVIEDARSRHDTRNVRRLLDQAISHPEQNNFVELHAAIYISFLAARGSEADLEIANAALEQVEVSYR